MTKIILNSDEKLIQLQAELDKVQNRCTARILNAGDIASILHGVDNRLNIPKTYRKGLTVHYTGAQKFPSAYKQTPYSTHFTAVHNGICWAITDIGRYTCPNRLSDTHIDLPDAAKEFILKRIADY